MATYIIDASVVIEYLVSGQYTPNARALYIALASRLGRPFITIDQRQSRAAAAEGVSLTPITHFN